MKLGATYFYGNGSNLGMVSGMLFASDARRNQFRKRCDVNERGEDIVAIQTESNTDLLTAKEAAAYLRVSLNTLWRMERRKLIVPYRTPGGHRRYTVAMLRMYLEQTRARSAR